MQTTPDGDLVVSLQTGSAIESSDFRLAKVSPQGVVRWVRHYEQDGHEGNSNVIVLNDGYLIAGLCKQYTANGTGLPSQFCVLKTDTAGNLQWQRAYGHRATLLQALPTSDGGFILSGYRYSDTTGYDMQAMKLRANGDLEWKQSYGTEENDGGCSVDQYNGSTYFLSGVLYNLQTGNNDAYTAYLDNQGIVIRDSSYNLGGEHSIFYPYTLLPDGGCIGVANTYYPYSMRITRFSVEGEIIHESPWLSSGLLGEDYIRDIEPTADGGFITAGFNLGAPTSAWVVKFDSNGNTCGIAPCQETITAIAPPSSATGSSLRLWGQRCFRRCCRRARHFGCDASCLRAIWIAYSSCLHPTASAFLGLSPMLVN